MAGRARAARRTLAGAALVWLAGCGSGAPATPPVRTVSPGVRDTITQLQIPGSELEPVPRSDHAPPIVLRITGAWPHGTDWRYDLEWYGLDPGDHDLRDYLQRVDGSALTGVPSMPVRVTDVLPPGQVLPHDVPPGRLPKFGGYTALLWTGIVAWVAGLLAIVFWRRRRPAPSAQDVPPATFADRLRPLVDAAMAGRLPTADQARLERMLLAFWRARLELGTCTAVEALQRLRAHDEAGALLRQLEAWLHAPPGRGGPVDVAALLTPYRALPADAYERLMPA